VQAGQRSAKRARVLACGGSARAWKEFSHTAGCHPGAQAQPRVKVRIFARHTEKGERVQHTVRAGPAAAPPLCAGTHLVRVCRRDRDPRRRRAFVGMVRACSRAFPNVGLITCDAPATRVNASPEVCESSRQTSADWHSAVGSVCSCAAARVQAERARGGCSRS
jgi:hypothetical protein